MVSSSAIGYFDVAIATICAWLVPRLISRHRLYHRTLRRSPNWVSEHVDGGSLEVAEKAVTRSMYIALASSLTIYTATAITLSLLTRDIDNRTSYIIVGLSNLVGAIFIFLLSYNAPQWLGVYSSIYSNGRRTPLGASLDALCSKVRLHVFRTFFKVYPTMIPFFLGANAATIPVSVIVGCLVGFLLCLFGQWRRRFEPSLLVHCHVVHGHEVGIPRFLGRLWRSLFKCQALLLGACDHIFCIVA